MLGTPICPAMMPQEGWCPCDGSVPTLGLFPSPNRRFVPRGNPHGTNPGTGETKQRLCRGMRKPEQPHAWVPRIPQPSRCPALTGATGTWVLCHHPGCPQGHTVLGRAGGKGLWTWPSTSPSSLPRVPPQRPEPASPAPAPRAGGAGATAGPSSPPRTSPQPPPLSPGTPGSPLLSSPSLSTGSLSLCRQLPANQLLFFFLAKGLALIYFVLSAGDLFWLRWQLCRSLFALAGEDRFPPPRIHLSVPELPRTGCCCSPQALNWEVPGEISLLELRLCLLQPDA